MRIRLILDGMNRGLIVLNLVRKNMVMVYYFSPYSSIVYRLRVLFSSTFTTLQIVLSAVYIHSLYPSIYVFVFSYQLFRSYLKSEKTIRHVVYCNHHMSLFTLFTILGKAMVV